ncbi:helix-turn-helix domain-containing protein [Archangium violaceum]|uniref:helix-turn-helix domain-containing protein n=1 Tax=Archangium violaceum TaxID=83451 RepID=UPI0036DF940B
MAGVDVERLARAMKARKLSTDDLARLIGYSPETITAYLSGRRQASDAFAVMAEVVLKLKAESLGRTT